MRQRVSFVRRITRPVPLRRDACSGPRFANRSQMTRVSGAACVELNTPRGGLGEHDARRGRLRTQGVVGACAPAVEEALVREARIRGVSRDETRGRGSRPAVLVTSPVEGCSPAPLMSNRKASGTTNNTRRAARAPGRVRERRAAFLRRESLCGVLRCSRRARRWRAVHDSGARAV